MKKITGTFILLILLVNYSYGQRSPVPEIGLTIGGTNFIGDVGRTEFHMPNNVFGGVFFRKPFNPHYSIRASFSLGTIGADDADAKSGFKNDRNLSFESRVTDINTVIEFNFLPYLTGNKGAHTPYVFLGVGLTLFNPKAELNGEMIELQPLRTEGQGTSVAPDDQQYKLTTVNIPFGVGYKVSIGDIMSINAEVGFRRTYSDYIDDVSGRYVNPTVLANEVSAESAALSDRSLSQTNNTDRFRGNPQNNDWYIFTGVSIVFKLARKYEPCYNW